MIESKVLKYGKTYRFIATGNIKIIGKVRDLQEPGMVTIEHADTGLDTYINLDQIIVIYTEIVYSEADNARRV